MTNKKIFYVWKPEMPIRPIVKTIQDIKFDID